MATNGIREGRARFGDDVRERARKYFEAQKGKKDTAEAMPVKPAKKIEARPLSKSVAKPTAKKESPAPVKKAKPQSEVDKQIAQIKEDARTAANIAMHNKAREDRSPNTPAISKYAPIVPTVPTPEPLPQKSKAAVAREKMWEGSSPVGDAVKAMTPAKKSPYSEIETEARKGQIERAKSTPYSEAESNKGSTGPRFVPMGAMRRQQEQEKRDLEGLKKGGKVKKMAKGGSVNSSASRRGDGIAQRGKTKGRML